MCKDLPVPTTTPVITTDIVSVDGYPFGETITFCYAFGGVFATGSHSITIQGRSNPDEEWGAGQTIALTFASNTISIKNYPYMRLRISMANNSASRTLTAWVGR